MGRQLCEQPHPGHAQWVGDVDRGDVREGDADRKTLRLLASDSAAYAMATIGEVKRWRPASHLCLPAFAPASAQSCPRSRTADGNAEVGRQPRLRGWGETPSSPDLIELARLKLLLKLLSETLVVTLGSTTHLTPALSPLRGRRGRIQGSRWAA